MASSTDMEKTVLRMGTPLLRFISPHDQSRGAGKATARRAVHATIPLPPLTYYLANREVVLARVKAQQRGLARLVVVCER